MTLFVIFLSDHFPNVHLAKHNQKVTRNRLDKDTQMEKKKQKKEHQKETNTTKVEKTLGEKIKINKTKETETKTSQIVFFDVCFCCFVLFAGSAFELFYFKTQFLGGKAVNDLPSGSPEFILTALSKERFQLFAMNAPVACRHPGAILGIQKGPGGPLIQRFPKMLEYIW